MHLFESVCVQGIDMYTCVDPIEVLRARAERYSTIFAIVHAQMPRREFGVVGVVAHRTHTKQSSALTQAAFFRICVCVCVCLYSIYAEWEWPHSLVVKL